MTRTPDFALAVCTALLAPVVPLPAQGANVLVIVADDLGVDQVGVYAEGPNPAPTPNVDALARRGVLFRNAWADALCSPTRACLQTGRYPVSTRVGTAIPLQRAGVLPLREYTIPEVLDLGGSGYTHAAIGKWHLGDPGDDQHPNHSGWSHFAGLIPGAITDYYDWPRTVDGRTRRSTTYTTTRMVDDALAWIGRQSGPWLCYLAFNAPHTPYQAPPPALHSQDLTGLDPGTDPVPFHHAMVEAMDHEIGRLLAALGPDLAHTNVVFLGDNGTSPLVSQSPFEPEHAKGTPYEGGVNVPLVIAGPAVRSPGREVEALAAAVDVFATVTELAGVDAAAVVPPWLPLDAVSLVPYLRNPRQTPLRTVVDAEQFGGDTWPALESNGFATARGARYKLIRTFRPQLPPREELYDLQADPFEQSDLLTGALSAAERLALASLRAELDRLRGPSGGTFAYGTAACPGSNGIPQLVASGTPSPGGSYTVALLGGAVRRPVAMLLGASDTVWGALPLPFDMTVFGAGPGCTLYCSGEGQIMRLTSATGTAVVTVPLPATSDLVGGLLFHSFVVEDPAAPDNTLGVTLSNGAAVSIGI